jgi:3D (Asp-Asp-Asp) domain-containing protein
MIKYILIPILIVIGMILLINSLCYADEVVSQTYRVVTAYNAGDVSQTDDTPCIDASNDNICHALDRGELRCAANFVKLGTLIHIDSVGTCLVTDRTNKRYRNRVDVAMKKHEKKKALRFGRKVLMVKILKKK